MPELSTALSTGSVIFSALACFFCAFAWRAARKSAQYASDCALYVGESNKKSVSLLRIAEISADLTELQDSYNALLKSHKKLRARIGMREVQKARNAAQLELGSLTDKQALREAARDKGILRS